jgi:hypothetical protein
VGLRDETRLIAGNGGNLLKEKSPDKGSEAQILRELTRLLDRAPVDWSLETLTHNTHNAVTAGIWRVRVGSASFVLKVVSPESEEGTSEEVHSSEVPSCWNYWEREVLAYESGITALYSETGIMGPRPLPPPPRPARVPRRGPQPIRAASRSARWQRRRG